jgi:hypothetical protein
MLLCGLQCEALSVPRVESGIFEYNALVEQGVKVDWRGKLYAPQGVIDAEGYVTLPPRPSRSSHGRSSTTIEASSTSADAAEGTKPLDQRILIESIK